jgi:hypothetical protein
MNRRREREREYEETEDKRRLKRQEERLKDAAMTFHLSEQTLTDVQEILAVARVYASMAVTMANRAQARRREARNERS